MALIILGITFFGFLILGVPVAFAIGLASICTILYEGLPLAVLYQQMMSGMNVFSFLAIPFFIFSGELMLHGGVADKIVALAKSAVGHIRGGLGMSNVVACTLFGGVCGSAVADVSAMGAVMIPMMKKEGYHADYAVNVTTHSALVGALMPTSHNMIIYALAAGGAVSISALIVAGLLPALVLMLCMLAAAYLVAVKRGYPAGTFPGWNAVGRAAIAGVPGLLIIVIILAGILSGVFTATEAAAVAVTYTILLTFLVYRTMTWDHFLEAAAKAVKTTGVVLLLIGVSAMFQYLMGSVRSRGFHRQPSREDLDDAVGRVPGHQRDPVCAGNVHGHGGHDPDLHADLPADRNEVRHGPGAVRHGDAHQLRLGLETRRRSVPCSSSVARSAVYRSAPS
jgi:tripartite ATP-independent transporter DctM subunit